MLFRIERECIFGLSGMVFSGCERSNKSSNILQDGPFDDIQESRFEASKILNNVSAILLVGRSADVQEFCFQPAKV